MSATPARAMTGSMLALSTAAHVLAFIALSFLPAAPPAPPAQPKLEPIELLAPDEPAPAREVALESPAPPSPPIQPPVRAPRPQPRPQPARVERPPTPATVATTDLAQPALPDGSLPIPVSPPAATRPAPAPSVAASSDHGVPGFVPASALSRKPGAPGGLDLLLQRHYPPRARTQEVAGKVVVRMRIAADGRVGPVEVIREQPTGFEFARACRTMLSRAPRFVPGLDRSGRAVATEATFTCTFDVEY